MPFGLPIRRIKLRHGISYVSCLVPFVLAFWYWQTRPFVDAIASHTVSLNGLTAAQKFNIELATRSLDGVVMKPNEQFSFNRTVGPRTIERGYRQAPVYLGSETISSVGGGICLVSSCLYQIVLASGLSIVERVAHTRTIKSIPPGLDATVWYGKSDLRFINNLDCPIQIKAEYTPNQATIQFKGAAQQVKPLIIKRFESIRSDNKLLVEVLKQGDKKQVIVSRDLYDFSR